jgi:lysophospholipase L1-like esterase
VPATLPQGTVVLQIGDSMADALGKDLGRELEARGVRSILKAKEATYIPEWAGFSMGLKNLLAIHKPDLVIITLGGNEVAMRDPSVRAEPVRQIVEAIGDRPCVWVGAPLWGPHTGILDVIRTNCSPCRFVDTNALVPNLERLKDGVHPTLPERKRWAKAMIGWLGRQRDPTGTRPWDLKP